MRAKAQAPINTLRTPEEAAAWFVENGITVSAWAREHGLPRQAVFDLLHKRLKGNSGQAHRAAVALRLKADPKLKRAA